MMPIDNPEIYSSKKILDPIEAASFVSKLKLFKKKVGLCHGCFDFLHPGHIQHLESSKKLCDFLIVSLTADKFIISRKGFERPLFSEKLRAYMIASLECVDCVVISYYERGTEILELIKPSIYFKGIDIIGLDTPSINEEIKMIQKVGGKIEYTHDPKLSTTEILEHIKNSKPSI